MMTETFTISIYCLIVHLRIVKLNSMIYFYHQKINVQLQPHQRFQ